MRGTITEADRAIARLLITTFRPRLNVSPG